MRLALTCVMGLAGLVVSTGSALAQVFQPVGKQLDDVSGALQKIQGKSAVYEPTKPDKEFKLFYIPFFALEESQLGSGRPKVRVQKSPNPGNGLVTVTLLLSPQNLVDGIAQYVRASTVLNGPDDRYKNVQPFNLTGIPLRNLTVDEVEPRYGFRQVTQPNFGAQGTLELVAEMTMEKAEQVASDIESSRRAPQFDVRYDLATDQELSETAIRASAVYLHQTDAAKELSSAKPGGEKFGFQVGPAGLQISQPFLTKSQQQVFEGRIKTEVSMVLRIGNEKDVEFVRQMTDYFRKVFERVDELKLDGPLSQQLANLSSYGLDQEDLKADKLDKLVADVKNFFSQEDWEKKTFEAGASASFLGIGGSGSVKTSGESLHKMMTDKGWRFEAQGHITVPKAFEVHIVNRTSLKSEGAVSGAVVRQQRGFTGFNHRVSAANLYHPTAAKDVFVEVAELRAQAKQLSDALGVTNGNVLKIASGSYGVPGPNGFVQGNMAVWFNAQHKHHASQLIQFDQPFKEVPTVMLTWSQKDFTVHKDRLFFQCEPVQVTKEGFHIDLRFHDPEQITSNSAIRWLAIGK